MSKHFYAIAIIFLAVIFFSLSLYGLRVFGSRTNAVQEEIIVAPQKQVTSALPDDTQDLLDDQQEETSSDQVVDPDSTIIEQPSDAKKSAYHITRENCANECATFDENTPSLRYCQQICGIILPKDNDIDCTVKSGLSRDYCIKDRAVSSNTSRDCEEISDKGIWNQCRTQIIENTVDGF